MSQSDIAKDAATLCITCGLCCNGTLFSYVPIDADDQKDRLPEDADNDGDKLFLPCAYHSNETGCQIYTTRPNICRKYECLLLRRLLEGETALDDAIAIVKTTKKQRAKVIDAIDANAIFTEPTPLVAKFTQVYLNDSNLSTSSETEKAELFLAYMGLVHLIKRYFFPKFRKDFIEGVNDGLSEKDS